MRYKITARAPSGLLSDGFKEEAKSIQIVKEWIILLLTENFKDIKIKDTVNNKYIPIEKIVQETT